MGWVDVVDAVVGLLLLVGFIGGIVFAALSWGKS